MVRSPDLGLGVLNSIFEDDPIYNLGERLLLDGGQVAGIAVSRTKTHVGVCVVRTVVMGGGVDGGMVFLVLLI